MIKWKTLVKKQTERNLKERRDLLREALEAGGWTYAGAADLLGLSVSGMQCAVERDAILKAERDKKAERAGMGGRPAA